MKKVKGVIFDFDGVIVDSELLFTQSMVNYLGDKGIKTDIDDVTFLVGKNERRIALDVIEKYGISDSYEKVREDIETYYEKFFNIKELQPFDGLIEFLNNLEARGIKKVIASSSNRDYLNNLLEALKIGDQFECVLSGQDFENGKPAPDIYLAAIKEINLPKENIVVIEDSLNGIKAAKAADLYTIGFKASKIIQDTSLADVEVSSYAEMELLEVFNK